MAISDWFKKAKEAKKEKAKEKEKLPDLGFLGKGGSSKAYKEAQVALAEEENED